MKVVSREEFLTLPAAITLDDGTVLPIIVQPITTVADADAKVARVNEPIKRVNALRNRKGRKR